MVHMRQNQNAINETALDDDSKKESTKRRLMLWLRQGRYIVHMFAVSFLLLMLTTPPATMMNMVFQDKRIKTTPDIPDCDASPWKPHENLVGTCPGIRPTAAATAATTAADCARYCCANPNCITWQWRRDKGCLTGGDVRIGHEKDGPAAYCSNHPPYKWQGQFVLVANDGKERTHDPTACSTETWNPQQHQGQCFGLGDVRKNIHSAQECMQTCCGDDQKCGAWQFHAELGCFYGPRMFACQPSNDPVAFEAYVGRRKIQSSRSYS